MVDGRKGWDLIDYVWNPENGQARFIYERVRDDTGEIEERVVTRPQPLGPGHTGWLRAS